MTTRRLTAGAAAVIGLAATAALAQFGGPAPPVVPSPPERAAERLRPAFDDGAAIPSPTDPFGNLIGNPIGEDRPEVSAADFLNQSRERSTAEVERLSGRCEQLRAQLRESETELARWRAIDQALASASQSRRPDPERPPDDLLPPPRSTISAPTVREPGASNGPTSPFEFSDPTPPPSEEDGDATLEPFTEPAFPGGLFEDALPELPSEVDETDLASPE